MRIPLTKYGWPQVATYPAIIFAAMAVCLAVGIFYLDPWAVISLESLLAVTLICILLFFRDPHRISPPDDRVLLAPADGRITDIRIVEEDRFIGGTALRIGIFLGIFDTHINRAPCNAKVERITYRPGRYKNALSPACGHVNERNDLEMTRIDTPEDRLIVRQISGAVARRIVCEAYRGQELASGQKFGMIKFGSRTELYLTAHQNAKCLIQVGEKVKAGLTPIVRYEIHSG
ncbi:MAG: phosphatidylserine decarboxylase [Planctomycetota bacterium]|jgi:phosphatidylserine decarboxylase